MKILGSKLGVGTIRRGEMRSKARKIGSRGTNGAREEGKRKGNTDNTDARWERLVIR